VGLLATGLFSGWLVIPRRTLAGFGVQGFPVGFCIRRLRFGLSLRVFFGGSSYCCWVWVFEIACQISLTPRHVTAENGRGSSSWNCRMAAADCRWSFWVLNLSVLVAITVYRRLWNSNHFLSSKSFSIQPRRASR